MGFPWKTRQVPEFEDLPRVADDETCRALGMTG